jgi:plasmid stability protein
MPSLQVRELPVNIYRRLRKSAKAEHRSLAQEAVFVLAKGLQASVSNKERRTEILQSITEHEQPLTEQAAAVDSISLVREDREKCSVEVAIC